METSISWALGQKVREDKRVKTIPSITPALKEYTQPIFRPKTPIHIGFLDPEITKIFSPEKWNGVIGDATLASKEKGQKMLKPTMDAFVEFLKKIKQIRVELKKRNRLNLARRRTKIEKASRKLEHRLLYINKLC